MTFFYMFFAFCWYDEMPTATFNSSPRKERRRRKVTTYKRFTYPYPDTEEVPCRGRGGDMELDTIVIEVNKDFLLKPLTLFCYLGRATTP